MQRRVQLTHLRRPIPLRLLGLVLWLLVAAEVALIVASPRGSAWIAGILGRDAGREAVAPDWDMAGQESAQLLAAYLRFDTSNPPGHEEQAARWLLAQLQAAGIPGQVVVSGRGRANVIARLNGQTGAPPLILFSHIDVQPPDGPWSVQPFGGVERDGVLYGRGAVEPKGQTITNLATMLWLQRSNAQLDRDVIFLAVADEETPAESGVRYLLEHFASELEAGFVIGPGNGIATQQDGGRSWLVSTYSKGEMTVRIASSSPNLQAADATSQLSMTVDRMLSWQSPLNVSETTNEYFRRLASRYPFPVSSLLSRPGVWKLLVAPSLLMEPAGAALLRDEISLIRVESWPDDPLRPSAVLQVRYQPGRSTDSVLAELRTAAEDPELVIEVLEETPGQESPWGTPLFRAIEAVAKGEGGAVSVLPTAGEANGMRYFRAKGVICYGLLPFDLERGEMAQVGQIDEHIDQANLTTGVRRMVAIVETLCGVRKGG